MLQLEVLIRELPPINGLPSSSIVVCEIAPLEHKKQAHTSAGWKTKGRRNGGFPSYLTHKLRDDAVECGSLVTEAVLARAQRSEVLWEEDTCRRLVGTFEGQIPLTFRLHDKSSYCHHDKEHVSQTLF